MYTDKLISTSILLLALSIITFTCYADVEDIIASQGELLKSDSEKMKEERNTVKHSKNGVELGRQEFIDTCAMCHGEDGKGKGPFSLHLATKPKDLTQIRINNNGEFPFKKLYDIIDGRKITQTHGSRTMPIWGDHYSAESWFEVSTQYAETLARGRILELLLYLESIQDK